MALNNIKCNRLMPLHFKGLTTDQCIVCHQDWAPGLQCSYSGMCLELRRTFHDHRIYLACWYIHWYLHRHTFRKTFRQTEIQKRLHRDGDCGNPAEPAGIPQKGNNVAGFQWGWKQMSRDSHGDGTKLYGNVALFDFYRAHAATKICFQTVE